MIILQIDNDFLSIIFEKFYFTFRIFLHYEYSYYKKYYLKNIFIMLIKYVITRLNISCFLYMLANIY